MIEVEGLTKYYGPVRAVNQVSFRIGKGEIVGLLGLNGSGKTTVLRMLAGSLLPTSGSVKINGIDLVERPYEAKRLLSFLPETPPLYGEMTVRSYLAFTGQLKGLRGNQLHRRLAEVGEKAAIQHVMDHVIEQLSFGYRQRVGIAMSLIQDPAVLLLDEPAAGLDPIQIVEMRQLIMSLRGERTVIFSSHHLSEISQVCDRIMVIQDGEIAGEGSEEDLSRRLTQHLRVRLQARGPAGSVLECLKGMAGVAKIEELKSVESVSTFNLLLTQDVREGMVLQLVSRGYGVQEVTRTDLELENLFLKLMGRGEKAA